MKQVPKLVFPIGLAFSVVLGILVFTFMKGKEIPLTIGPEKGALLLAGGGDSESFYENFAMLAGGKDAAIVVIPTAESDDWLMADPGFEIYKKSFEARGFSNITILHTRDRGEADSEEFIQPLQNAGGVWIAGGRQWRLADSYLNTKTHEALWNLLDRNGVIAGTSAGATIQGSYLVRGDTKTNTIMMGDHEEGFGFITNIAVDQHLLARNRQFDLFEILEKRPELLGIGLDENAGIVVKGNWFEVIGESYIAVYDGKMWSEDLQTYSALPPGSRSFYLLRPGEKYDLLTRRKIKASR